MIKEKLAAIVYEAISCAECAGQISLSSSQLQSLPISISQPRSPEHGDLSCPVAMEIVAQMPSHGTALEVAQILVSYIKSRSEDLAHFARVEAVAPGFINFGLGPRLVAEILLEIVSLGPNYGLNRVEGGETVDVCSVLGGEPDETKGLSLNQVQYAYARCSAILRQAIGPRVNILSGQLEAPLMTPDYWQAFLMDCKINSEIYLDLDLFRNDPENHWSNLRRSQTLLILKLGTFREVVVAATDYRQPECLARYALDLANDLTYFCKQFNLDEGFFSPQLSVIEARLGLILAIRQVLGNALGIIGVPVPEHL